MMAEQNVGMLRLWNVKDVLIVFFLCAGMSTKLERKDVSKSVRTPDMKLRCIESIVIDLQKYLIVAVVHSL